MIEYDEDYKDCSSDNYLYSSMNQLQDYNSSFIMVKEDIANKLLYADVLLFNHNIDRIEHSKITQGLNEIKKRIDNGTIPINNNQSIQSFIRDTLNYYIGKISLKLYNDYSEEDQKINDLNYYIYNCTNYTIDTLIKLNMMITAIYDINSDNSIHLSEMIENDIMKLQHLQKSLGYNDVLNSHITLSYFKSSPFIFDLYNVSNFTSLISIVVSHINKISDILLDDKASHLNIAIINKQKLNMNQHSIKINSNITTLLNITSFCTPYDHIDDITDIIISSYNEYIASFNKILNLIKRRHEID